MKHKIKSLTTSKIILYGSNFLCDVIIGIILYGWVHGAMDAAAMLTDIIIVKGILYACYFIKAGIENNSKGKLEIQKLSLGQTNDLLTLLQGILNGFQSGNGASAISSLVSSLQQIIQDKQIEGQSEFINHNESNTVDSNIDNSIAPSMGESNIQNIDNNIDNSIVKEVDK